MTPTLPAAPSPPSDRACRTLPQPAVHRSQQFARLLDLTLVTPEPRHAHRRAHLPGFCLLLTRDSKCAIKLLFRFFRLRRVRLECDFPGNAMNLGLAPFFLRSFYF